MISATEKPRVALIEDHDDLREEILNFLDASGYSCWGAESAEQFYKLLHANPAGVVLVDITLPGEDGFSVIEYLRRYTACGIIAVTARHEREDRLRGITGGADHYLCKPLDMDELRITIDNLWSRISLNFSDVVIQPSCWQLDLHSGALINPEGRTLYLSEQEAVLLNVLISQPDSVFTKDSLHHQLYPGEPRTDHHRIDVIVNRIRKKARDADIQLPLRAVFGKGLVFRR